MEVLVAYDGYRDTTTLRLYSTSIDRSENAILLISGYCLVQDVHERRDERGQMGVREADNWDRRLWYKASVDTNQAPSQKPGLMHGH